MIYYKKMKQSYELDCLNLYSFENLNKKVLFLRDDADYRGLKPY